MNQQGGAENSKTKPSESAQSEDDMVRKMVEEHQKRWFELVQNQPEVAQQMYEQATRQWFELYNSASKQRNSASSSATITPQEHQYTAAVESKEPVYVNAKQYARILKRREQRAKLERRIKNTPRQKTYIHESRHKFAKRRKRGPSGRFLTKAEIEKLEMEGLGSGLGAHNSMLDTSNDDDGDNRKNNSQDQGHDMETTYIYQ